jgi:hypothetical protein
LKDFDKDSFIIVFTPYETEEVLKRANVIVSIPNGFEREGSFYNLENKLVKKSKVLTPKFETIDLKVVLNELSKETLIK